jgi:hypothetical protein
VVLVLAVGGLVTAVSGVEQALRETPDPDREEAVR